MFRCQLLGLWLLSWSASLPTAIPAGKPKGIHRNRIPSQSPTKEPKKKHHVEDADDGFGYPPGESFTWEMPPDGDLQSGSSGLDDFSGVYGAADAALSAELAAADAKPEDTTVIKYGLST